MQCTHPDDMCIYIFTCLSTCHLPQSSCTKQIISLLGNITILSIKNHLRHSLNSSMYQKIPTHTFFFISFSCLDVVDEFLHVSPGCFHLEILAPMRMYRKTITKAGIANLETLMIWSFAVPNDVLYLVGEQKHQAKSYIAKLSQLNSAPISTDIATIHIKTAVSTLCILV